MKNPKFNRADQLMLGLKDRCQKLNAGEKFLPVRQIMEEMRGRRSHYTDSVRGLLYSLVIEIIRLNEEQEAKQEVQGVEMQKHSGVTQIAAALDYVRMEYMHMIRVEELAQEEALLLLCGHYEGVDERVLEMIATDYLSAGDYVLTGGELPAMMMIDCISRLVPGVLNNNVSAEFETFHDNLLEYPQYSRPEEWHGKKVPEVLMSGHHANIEKWRREQSIYRTAKRRPDLLKKADLTNKEWNYVRQLRKQWKEEEEQIK